MDDDRTCITSVSESKSTKTHQTALQQPTDKKENTSAAGVDLGAKHLKKRTAQNTPKLISAVERKYALDDAKMRLQVQAARLPNKQQLGGRFFSAQQLLEKNLPPHALIKARNPLRQVHKSEKQRQSRRQTGKALLAETGVDFPGNHAGSPDKPVTMDEYFQQAEEQSSAAFASFTTPASLLDTDAASCSREPVTVTTGSGATIIVASRLPHLPSKSSQAVIESQTYRSATHESPLTYRGDSRASIPYGQQNRVRQYQQEILDLADHTDDGCEAQSVSDRRNAAQESSKGSYNRARLASRLGVGANATFGSVLAYTNFVPPELPLPPGIPAVQPPFSVFPTVAMFRSFERMSVNPNPALRCSFIEQHRPDGSLKPPKLVTQSVVLLRSKILQRLMMAALPLEVVHELQLQQHLQRTRRADDEKSSAHMGSLFKSTWDRLALFESTPSKPGSALATDFSGSSWGMSDTFNQYTGTASRAVNTEIQAAAGVTQLLLQQSGVPFGWQGAQLDLRGWHVTPLHMRAISSFGEHVEELKLTAWQSHNLDASSLDLIFNSFPKLRRLAIPGCAAMDFNAADSLAASTLPSRLTQFDVSCSTSLDDRALIVLGASCIHLEDLSLASCPQISDVSLTTISMDLAKLKSLDLSWCLQVTDKGIIPLLARCPIQHFSVRGVGLGVMSASDAAEVALNKGVEFDFPSKLPLGWYPIGERNETIPVYDSAGKLVATGCGPAHLLVPMFPGLRGGEWLRQSLMDALVEVQISSLKTIDMSMCVGVTDEVVISLLRNSSGLERLRLSHCHMITAASTTAIALFCPDILEIHIPYCFGITSPIVDRDVALLLAKRAGIIRSTNGALSTEADAGITVGISKMMQRAETSRMRYSVPFFPGDGIDADAQDESLVPHLDLLQPKWSGLQIVNISGTSGVQELDLSRLVKSCPNLKQLRCSGVHNVTCRLLEELRPLSLPLLMLSLGHLPALDDDAVKTVVQSAPDLMQLDITGSSSVSDAGLAYVSMHCPLLEEFRFNLCSRAVSSGAVMALAKSCRLLKVLEVSQRSDQPNFSHRSGPFAKVGDAADIDYSFDGSLLLFVVGIGLCCPYLEVLDLSGRKLPKQVESPRGLGASIELDGEVFAAGSARGLVQRAKSADVLGISKRSSQRISSLLSGTVTVEDVVSTHGENLLTTTYRAPQTMSSNAAEEERGHKPETSVIPLVASKSGPVATESMFAQLKSLNLSHCSALSTQETLQIVAAAPLLLQLNLTGVGTIDTAALAALGHHRELVNFSIEYEDAVSTPLASSAIFGFPGQRPGSRSNFELGQSLASMDKKLAKVVLRRIKPDDNRQAAFMGFRPVPGASLLVDATLLSKRIGLERVSANKIRRLILHGLRIEKQLLFTITWRVATKRAARVQYSARRITRFVRHTAAWTQRNKQQSASAIAMWWRRLQIIFRCQERVMAAILAKRSAQTKVLAASLLLQTFRGIWQRLGFNWLRMRALVGRWEDERRVNRMRGLVPRYDARGRLNVQFALPDDGPEVLGALGPATSPIPKRPVTRQQTGTKTLPSRLAAAGKRVPKDALSKLVEDRGGLRLRQDSDLEDQNIIKLDGDLPRIDPDLDHTTNTLVTQAQKSAQHSSSQFDWGMRPRSTRDEQFIADDTLAIHAPHEWNLHAHHDLRPYRTQNPHTSVSFIAKFLFGESLQRMNTAHGPQTPAAGDEERVVKFSPPELESPIGSPYRIPSGKVHAVLSNPARIGWDNVAKAPPVSAVHSYLDRITDGANIPQNDMLLQLANSQAPIESMQVVLGPRAFVAAAKKRIAVELEQRLKHRSSWKDQQLRLLKACEKRSRQAAARKIQLFYRQHLFERVVTQELTKALQSVRQKAHEADRQSGLHRQSHSGFASEEAIKASIILQKAVRRHSAKVFALHVHRSQSMTQSADFLRVVAAQLNGHDGEFQIDEIAKSCADVKDCLIRALNTTDMLRRASTFFKNSPVATEHRDSIIHAMQLCSNILQSRAPHEKKKATSLVSQAISAIRGDDLKHRARNWPTIRTEAAASQGTFGALYDSAGYLLAQKAPISDALMSIEVEQSVSRRFAKRCTAGQWLWLRSAGATADPAAFEVVSLNPILCTEAEAQDLLYILASSGKQPSLSDAIARYLEREKHQLSFSRQSEAEALPGHLSIKATLRNHALFANEYHVCEQEHEIVCGGLYDTSVLLEKSSQVQPSSSVSENITITVVVRSREPNQNWDKWKLACTMILRDMLVPSIKDVSVLGHEAVEAGPDRVKAAFIKALHSGRLSEAAVKRITIQARAASVLALHREPLLEQVPTQQVDARGQSREVLPDEPIADSKAASLEAKFQSHTRSNLGEHAAEQLAVEIYEYSHGLLSWAGTVAARLAREQRHWSSRCSYQRRAQTLSLDAFKYFFEQQLPLIVSDSRALVEYSQSQSHQWITRWQRSFSHLEEQASTMPKFSDARCRLNYERQQLRVALMRSRMASEQSHVSFAKQSLVVMSELESQQKSLLATLDERTRRESEIILKLEGEIPACQRTLDYVWERLGQLLLSQTKSQSSIRLGGGTSPMPHTHQLGGDDNEADELAALVSMMSGAEEDTGEEYGAMQLDAAASLSESDAPRASFERILQIEQIDSEWERVQMEKMVEVEVPVPFPWQESGNWMQHRNDAGQVYFYNKTTKTSQWEEPDWPSGERPPPLLDKVHKVEWVKRRHANSNHERKKRAKAKRRQSSQSRSSIGVVQRLLSDTSLQNFAASMSPQEQQMEITWLRAEVQVLEDTLERLQNVHLLTAAAFHNNNKNDIVLLSSLQRDLDAVQKAVEEHRRAKVEVLQLQAEIATDSYFNTNETLVSTIAMLQKTENRCSKRVAQWHRIKDRDAVQAHNAFVSLLPLRKPKFAHVQSTRQPKPRAPRKVTTKEVSVTVDENGKRHVTEKRVLMFTSPRRRRFRHAHAPPTAKSLLYYSATGSGEDAANDAFWYTGTSRDAGTLFGLFGIEVQYGTRRKNEASSEKDSSDEEQKQAEQARELERGAHSTRKEEREHARNKRRKKAARAVSGKRGRALRARRAGNQKLFSDMTGTPAQASSGIQAAESGDLSDYVNILQSLVPGFDEKSLAALADLPQVASLDVLACGAHALRLARKRGQLSSELFVETLKTYPKSVSTDCDQPMEVLARRAPGSGKLVAQNTKGPIDLTTVLPKSTPPELRLLSRAFTDDTPDGEFLQLFKSDLAAEQLVEAVVDSSSLFSRASADGSASVHAQQDIARKSPFPWQQHKDEWCAGISDARAGAWGSSYYVHIPSKLALWVPPSVAIRTSLLQSAHKALVSEAQRKAQLAARKASDLKKRKAAAEAKFIAAVQELHEIRRNCASLCHLLQSEAPDASEILLNQQPQELVLTMVSCTKAVREVTGKSSSPEFPEYDMMYPFIDWTTDGLLPTLPSLGDIVKHFACKAEFDAFKQLIFDKQAAIDAQDRKEWWNLMQLSDQQGSESRGFGGEAYFAESAEAYSSALQAALDRAVDRLLKCESDEQQIRFKIMKTLGQLHDALARRPVTTATTSVKALRENSTQASDTIAKRKFDRALRRKIQAAEKSLKDSLSRKAMLIFDIAEDSGTTQEELVARLRERARASRMAKHGVDSVQPDDIVYDSDEEAFFEWKNDNTPKFVSEGFKGVIGPDGSALQYLGDGTSFNESLWLHRYKLRPWATGAKLLESLSIGEHAASIHAATGSIDLAQLKDYKLGLTSLASSGLEARREQLEAKRRKREAAQKVKSDEETRVRAEKARRKIEREVTKQQEYRRQVGVNSSAQARLTTKEIKSADLHSASTLAMKGRKGLVQKLGDSIATRMASFSRQVRDSTRKLVKGDQPERDASGYEIHRVLVSEKSDANLRKREAEGILAAVKALRFVGGRIANAHMARAQAERLRRTGSIDGVFFKLKGNLGTEDFPVQLWYTRTSNMLEAAGHLILNSLSTDDPLFDDLQFNGYNYYTDAKVLPDHACWLLRGTGSPITSMAIATDHTTETHMRSQRFVPVQGGWGSSKCIAPLVKLFYKTEVVLKVNSFKMDEIKVLETELFHLRQLNHSITQRIEIAPKGSHGPATSDIEKAHFLRQEVKRLDGSNAPMQEGRQVVVAAEELGLSDAQISKLRQSFDKMGLGRDNSTSLPTILRYTGIRATPLYDALILALDKNFDGKVSFGMFMRTVVTFCMHDFEDLCGFLFAVVAPNLMDAVSVYKTAHSALFKETSGLHAWWDIGEAWRGPGHRQTPSLIPVLAFEVLLKSMHSPMPVCVKAVKHAIDDAVYISVGDCIGFYQFLALVKRHIILFHPVLEFQHALRRAFPGTGFWSQPVKNFGSIRSSWRDQLLAREQDTLKRSTVWLKELGECLPRSADVLAGRTQVDDFTLPELPASAEHID